MADTSSKETETREEKKPHERIPTISDYIRLFSYATKWDFCIYVVAALASMGAGVTLPLMNIVFGQLVGQFSNFFDDSGGMTRGDFEGILNRQALIIMGLFLGRWTLNTVNKFCFRMIGIRLSSAVRLHYLQSLFAQSIHVIDSMPAGAPANAITTTSNTLQIGISERLGTFLEFLSTIVGAFVVAFIWSWDLTLVTSSLILYIMFFMSFTMPLIVKGQTTTLQADTQGTAIASEALGGIRLIMACGAQDHVLARYEKWVHEAMVRAQKMAPVMGVQLGLSVCLRLSSPKHARPQNANLLTVLRSVWGVWPGFLVRQPEIHLRRHRECWRRHNRLDVCHYDSDIDRACFDASDCRQQGHCCGL